MKLRLARVLIASLLLAPAAGWPGSSPAAAAIQQADPSGDWRGVLEVGAAKLRIALHLGEVSTMDSPDQGAVGLPARLTTDGRKVEVAMPGVGSFEGELSEDGRTLSGVLMQGAARMPITFERGVFASANRPQTPLKPYPYREVEARYDNPSRPGVSLAGTLTVPEGQGPFPAVLLITGSGAQDRDESIFEHKPFLVLADHLTRRGIAVLRVDDRGVGGSRGAGPGDTSADYATDVEAGVAWLRSRAEIDPGRIGLIGHSEGGIIAPMVAAKDPAIAFAVLWAGSAVRGREIVIDQVRALNIAAGAPPEAAAQSVALQGALLDAIMGAEDEKRALAAATKILNEAGVQPNQLQTMTRPWYRFFLSHDPAQDLRRLRVPVLALLGEKDIQVSPELNEAPMRAALAGNPRAEVKVLPSLNHLFQTAKTGAVDEYGQIEQTISPAALKLIGDWVVARSTAP